MNYLIIIIIIIIIIIMVIIIMIIMIIIIMIIIIKIIIIIIMIMIIKRSSKKYPRIFIGDYVKYIALKEQHSGTSMSQMDLLRTKCIRFREILKSSVSSRLKLNDLKLIKPRRRLRS